MNINIQSVRNNELTVVTLTGSLDVSGAIEIEAEIRRVANIRTDIAVDLSGVTFISSQGARVLIIMCKAAAEKNRMLYLTGPKPQVRKVLGIMGIDKIMPIYDTVEEVGFPQRQ